MVSNNNNENSAFIDNGRSVFIPEKEIDPFIGLVVKGLMLCVDKELHQKRFDWLQGIAIKNLLKYSLLLITCGANCGNNCNKTLLPDTQRSEIN